jgi:hypothetical protein
MATAGRCRKTSPAYDMDREALAELPGRAKWRIVHHGITKLLQCRWRNTTWCRITRALNLQEIRDRGYRVRAQGDRHPRTCQEDELKSLYEFSLGSLGQ